ncbi:MAG: FkbM family methyltransferase, partial [Pseudomonadota bacterium]
LRRIVWAGRPDPFDVEVWPGQWARLYPRDNLSEKRAFIAPQFWDAEERAALAGAILRHLSEGRGPFVFVDAGANAGLYSLAARSVAGPDAVRILAIEPEPETCARLRFNLGAGSDAPARVVEAALAGAPGTLHLTVAGVNRGEVRISDDCHDGVAVPARTLAEVVATEGLPRIDALKIDIEGAEEPVLAAFFGAADRALWPALVIIEAPRGAETPALALLRETGYAVHARTKLNAVLTAPAPATVLGPAGGPGDGRDEAERTRQGTTGSDAAAKR